MPLPTVKSGDPHVPAHNAERTAINNLETSVSSLSSAVTGKANLASGKHLESEYVSRLSNASLIALIQSQVGSSGGGLSLSDNGDGTYTVTGSSSSPIVDNGDGTYTI